ncbi:MAG: AlpA family transcriptional regulator [Magnetococcales bacterium]|nr:AlpA family transcriptional regulator [Magnetococcales bacterium]
MPAKSQPIQSKTPALATPSLPTSDRFLRLPAIKERTGLPVSTIYDLMRKQLFPKQRHLGPRTVAWLESEIESWMNSRPACDEVKS